MFGTLLMLALALLHIVLFDMSWPALVLFVCALALPPVHFAVRSYAVKRMVEELEGA
jgi:hypothetical protein